MKFKYSSFIIIGILISFLFVSCGKSKRKVVFDTKPVSIKNSIHLPVPIQPYLPSSAEQDLPAKVGKLKPITTSSETKMPSKAEA